MQQLPLSITLRDDATFANFQQLDGNALALQALRQLSVDGDYGLTYLAGTPASGRSHLLQALCHQHPESVYLPLAELAEYPPAQVFAELESQPLVCLDDIDAVAGHSAWEERLFHLMNRKALIGGALVVSARQRPGKLFALPDLVSRLQQGLALNLAAADDEDKARIFIGRGKRRGMSITPGVAAFVLNHYGRDLAQLMALLDQLDRQSLEQQRRITIPFLRGVMGAGSNLQ